uniref:acylglycerol lipase n=1 Tax=Anolis carolinensis TaxID=28377 RepID=A0A803SLJ0_ANOCA|nr:PREDICTED: monoacylglycerol lipase ABHD6 [Anolis carolinensis]|eukprot:XP_016847176.1 PREDICTED: monoacylglycerol lipase ABHD6 [Anolis carolinensis]
MAFDINKILLMIAQFIAGLFDKKYSSWPSLLFRIMIWYKRLKRNVTVKYIEQDGYKFCYFSRGEPGSRPSVLMLHGFSFNKDMWLNAIKLFPRDVHLVCLDMPGHGKTTRLLAENYTAVDQAKKIHQFVEWTNLNKKPFHLVGMSMGGMIAGVYAALYPSDVCALSLLCPPGLQHTVESEFIRQLKDLRKSTNSHNNPLILMTVQQGEDLLKLGLYQPKTINMQLLKGYLEDRRPHKSFFLKCFLDMTSMESRYSLHDNMSKIKAPTQIIWGKDDKVMDPSGAEIIAKGIPDSQVHMLDKCGHFITLDRPTKSGKLLLDFYHSVFGVARNTTLPDVCFFKSWILKLSIILLSKLTPAHKD